MLANNRMRFLTLANGDVLLNIRRKLERTSTYTPTYGLSGILIHLNGFMSTSLEFHIYCFMSTCYRMSAKHIFELEHIENPSEKFSLNLSDHVCSCRKWELTSLPRVHALSAMKSRNFKVDDYISEYYKKARYISLQSCDVSYKWIKSMGQN